MRYKAPNTPRCQRGGVEALLTLGGIALGALAGILYAPRAGERTRRQLRRQSEALRDHVADAGENFAASVEDLAHSLARRLAAGQASLIKSRRSLGRVSRRWRMAWAR